MNSEIETKEMSISYQRLKTTTTEKNYRGDMKRRELFEQKIGGEVKPSAGSCFGMFCVSVVGKTRTTSC